MLEDIINYIVSLSPFWIYLTLFFFSFIENVVPPSPSDVVVVFGAALISGSDGSINFPAVLIITSIGSSMGFMLMYLLGKQFGERIIRKGKLKFVTPEAIAKTDRWFSKYGFKLITANRFLPGTRSVVSFFSGMSELNPIKTFIYATISAFLWNLVIIYFGMLMGNKVELIDKYLSLYGNIITLVTLTIVLAFIVRILMRNRKNNVKKN